VSRLKRIPFTSDNGHYGAHGLALLNEIRTWCGVEKGAVTKKDGFLYTKYIKGKWAFNIDNSANLLKSKQLALITALSILLWNHSAACRKAKPGRVKPGRGIIGTAHGQVVVILGHFYNSYFTTKICRFGKDVHPPPLRRYR
jgi:hypothetical protein